MQVTVGYEPLGAGTQVRIMDIGWGMVGRRGHDTTIKSLVTGRCCWWWLGLNIAKIYSPRRPVGRGDGIEFGASWPFLKDL